MRKIVRSLTAVVVALVIALAYVPKVEAASERAPLTVSVGDVIQFGQFAWRVLDVQGNRALILSDRVLEFRRYHHTFGPVTWATSEMRAYLNGEFLNRFSAADRARIAETNVINNNNPWFGTSGGSNTVDRVFLLSIEEVVRFFGDSGRLRNRPTGVWGILDQHSNARIARDLAGNASWWWLRSPGSTTRYAADVNRYGNIDLIGTEVHWYSVGIRPALWLYVGTTQQVQQEPTQHELVGRWVPRYEFRAGGFRPLYTLSFYDTFEFREDGTGRWGSHSTYPFGLSHYGNIRWSASYGVLGLSTGEPDRTVQIGDQQLIIAPNPNIDNDNVRWTASRLMNFEVVGSSLFLSYRFFGNSYNSVWELVREGTPSYVPRPSPSPDFHLIPMQQRRRPTPWD